MFALALQVGNDGLTLTEIIADVPHDFGALIVYLMFGLLVWFIWWGSKPGVVGRYGVKYDAAEEDADSQHFGTIAPEKESVADAAPIPTRTQRKRRSADRARIAWVG